VKSITELVNTSYEISREHGFWDEPYAMPIPDDSPDGEHRYDNPLSIPTKLWLAAGELVEAGNLHHKCDLNVDVNREKFIEEVADVFIRLFDLCGYMADHYNSPTFELEEAIYDKIEINRKRPHKHGKNY
jgi:NTP pyrophosphatase (non-canonical NTP hydrolase)